MVRTSFPAKFREFMKQFLIDLLNKVEKQVVDDKILTFKEEIPKMGVMDIAKNTSVKYISHKGDINYYPKDRQPFSIVSGTPAQTKAAIQYNDLLKKSY